MIAAWMHGKRGERYILGGQELTYRDYLDLVARVVGVDPPHRRLPYPVGWIAGKAGDLFEAVTGRETTVNSMSVGYAFTDRYRYRCDKAARELGYVVVPVEPAIRNAVIWFRTRGMIPSDESRHPSQKR
jgi:dihydroflavonol-4-reductase